MTPPDLGEIERLYCAAMVPATKATLLATIRRALADRDERIAALEAGLREAADRIGGEDIDPDGIAAARFRALADGDGK